MESSSGRMLMSILPKSHANLAGGTQCSRGCQSARHDNRCCAADVTGFAALHLKDDLVKTLCNIVTLCCMINNRLWTAVDMVLLQFFR